MDSFTEYSTLLNTTAIYPDRGNNLTYPALGLCGESGEVAEKVKKIMRDSGGELTDENAAAIAKELGDVLWYLNAMAFEIGYDLDQIAAINAEKLLGRRERGTLQGSGDDR